MRRKSTKSYEHLRPNDLSINVSTRINGEHETNNATKLISQSATNLAVSRNDSISPSALSTGAPSSSGGRGRSTTLNKLTRYLRSSVSAGGPVQAKDQTNQQRQPPPPPQIFISTKSLPDSLTSTNPSILNCCPNSLTPVSRQTSDRNATSSDNSKICDSTTTPTQCASGELTSKSITANLRQWKLPKYLRKFENRNNNNDIKCDKDFVVYESSVDTNHPQGNEHFYQLLPIIIQKVNTESSLTGMEQAVNGNCIERDGNGLDSTSCSPTPRSNSNLNTADIIDVRSYISQSRSDITPFYPERADSCKYRSHRSYYGDVSPMRRPRSKTVALTSQEHINNKIGRDGNNELRVPNALGRKHSHYCSSPTSNNLQLPEMAPNHTSISQERLSTGDLTSWVSNISDDPASAEQSSAVVIPANDAINLDPIRKQSDLQLVRCVKENAKSQQNYLVTPPISNLSLFFISPLMEKEFRAEAHQLNNRNGPLTIAFPLYNTYFDILIGVIIFATVSIAMFLLSASEKLKDTSLKWIWLSLFGLFSVIELFMMILFTKKLFRNRRKSFDQQPQASDTELKTFDAEQMTGIDSIKAKELQTISNTMTTSCLTISSTMSVSTRIKKYFEDKIIDCFSTWFRWHISLGFLMCLPAIVTVVHFFISSATNDTAVFDCHYGFLMLVCIVHFCNFTQLNCWMRSILGVLFALAFILGISLNQIEWKPTALVESNPNYSQPLFIISSDGTSNHFNETFVNRSHEYASQKKPHCFEKKIDVEIYLDLILVLTLVWFLNREFEIFYRFAFYSSSIAEKDKIRVQQMKNQADLLLQNIIPKHVADHLKNTAKYSENHHNVAIIFASLINFNELYDESYLGGREYLRVLNELIGDFDELLSRPEFASVEKIKTIGSTFMAASGLDNSLRDQHSTCHIKALMEFALAMQEVVAAFNKDLLEFDLILRIGFNVGDVTAGVIGTSKLHYDIWGDAVNTASRMESTGKAGAIQVTHETCEFLKTFGYHFKQRGMVDVKGKGQLLTYYVDS